MSRAIRALYLPDAESATLRALADIYTKGSASGLVRALIHWAGTQTAADLEPIVADFDNRPKPSYTTTDEPLPDPAMADLLAAIDRDTP